jgi:hypothetical protein
VAPLEEGVAALEQLIGRLVVLRRTILVRPVVALVVHDPMVA